mmetsp:Transcript_109842/g.218146  ORF Transcript_109842/g.218146 Transcript_109842/m.218146 type:complete len:608 (+) Transcript_109842:84-1907(+)
MIEYDPGYWAIRYVFVGDLWSGSVAPKAFTWAFMFGVFSFTFCKILGPVEPGKEDSVRMKLRRDMSFGWAVYTGILATLLVFRLNQAYSRYWECAKSLYQMRSNWFNAVSTAFAFCSTEEARQSDVKEFQRLMSRLVSWLCWASLHQLEEKRLTLEILDTRGMDEYTLNCLDEAPDQVEILMLWIQRLLFVSQQKGILNAPPPLVTRIFQELGQGVLEFNNMRKVRDIPIPYPYSQMVTLLLIFHVTFTAVAAAFAIDHDLIAFMITFMSVMANVGAYYVSHEVERPFGSNMNDLPMVESMNWLNRSLSLILDPAVQQPPKLSGDFRDRGTTVTFKIYESFADCHRKSVINMDAYDAVVHDFEGAYDMLDRKSQESRASQESFSFSATSSQSPMKFRGRSLDSCVELASMERLDSSRQTFTHAHSGQLQSVVDNTQLESLGQVPALAVECSSAFANAAAADAGQVPLLRSSVGPKQVGCANVAFADAQHAPLLLSSCGPLRERQARSAPADVGQGPLLRSSVRPLQEAFVEAPVDVGQSPIFQCSGSPLMEGLAHAAPTDAGQAPATQSSGESLQAATRHASSRDTRHNVSPPNQGDRPDLTAGLHT